MDTSKSISRILGTSNVMPFIQEAENANPLTNSMGRRKLQGPLLIQLFMCKLINMYLSRQFTVIAFECIDVLSTFNLFFCMYFCRGNNEKLSLGGKDRKLAHFLKVDNHDKMVCTTLAWGTKWSWNNLFENTFVCHPPHFTVMLLYHDYLTSYASIWLFLHNKILQSSISVCTFNSNTSMRQASKKSIHTCLWYFWGGFAIGRFGVCNK